MQLATCIHTYPNGVHQVSKQDTHCGTINALYNCLNGCDFYTAIYEGTKPKLHGSWHLCKGLNMSTQISCT